MAPITVWVTQRALPVAVREVKRTLQGMLACSGYGVWSLTTWFCDNKTIRRYNLRHRKLNVPTDILSFPMLDAESPGHIPDPACEELRDLGSLLISLEYVKSTCSEEGVDPLVRLPVLYAHGICHLLGYDHQTDEDYERMQRAESSLLESYRAHLPTPDAVLDDVDGDEGPPEEPFQ